MKRAIFVLGCALTSLAIVAGSAAGQDAMPAGQASVSNSLFSDGDQSCGCSLDGCRSVALTDCESCDPCPRWTVSAAALLLHRSKARSAVLVEDAAHETLANVSDFDLGFAAGPRIDLTAHLDDGWEIGLTYFSVDGWEASRSLNDPGNLYVPLVSNASDDAFDTASALYASRLYSTEINLKKRWTDRIRILAGFRYVELHEAISASAYSDDLEGSLDVRTGNDLYGFQLGTEAILLDRGPFRIDGFLKAGYYGANIRATGHGEGTDFSMDGSTVHRQSAFLGELGLTANYRFNRHCSIYGGYEVMWIDRVALAADAVAAMNDSDADSLFTGDALYHGAMAGLTLSW